jgi:hypothetical protein
LHSFVQRIPLPGELGRSESQSRTPPVEGKVVRLPSHLSVLLSVFNTLFDL